MGTTPTDYTRAGQMDSIGFQPTGYPVRDYDVIIGSRAVGLVTRTDDNQWQAWAWTSKTNVKVGEPVRTRREAGQLVADWKPERPAATEQQIRDCARAIAGQALAIADGTLTGPRYAAVRKLVFNLDLLTAWVPDDRT